MQRKVSFAALIGAGVIIAGFIFNHQITQVYSQSSGSPAYELLVKSLKGDTDGVRELLAGGADPNTPPGPNDKGMTALMFAAWRGHDEIVRMLIKAGANVNAISESGMTPLMYAAYQGHLESVNYLLNEKADSTLKSKAGMTALMYAAQSGHTEVISALSPTGDAQRSEIPVKSNRQSPLVRVVRTGNIAAVEGLLQSNPPLEDTDQFGNTPLMIAARFGFTKIVIRLLNKGANINAQDTKGNTALSKAQVGRHNAVIEVLKSRGARN